MRGRERIDQRTAGGGDWWSADGEQENVSFCTGLAGEGTLASFWRSSKYGNEVNELF